ncbi:MAG TPA: septal ring lytic transglycosylase RlpA family protein [Solirubrobacterales bacterium]|nr:septal ring lytic transglycosylase RlpA family protein [Solirubrobacterales bacterium]
MLPVTALMITTGIAATATGTVPDPLADPGTGATASGGLVHSTAKLRVKRHAMAGGTIRLRGRLRPAAARRVTVRINGEKVKTVRTGADGRFRVLWSAPGPGVYEAKAVTQASGQARMARSRVREINVYRPAVASYYGPGLYGNGTACGQTLTPGTHGVANKSLPCGEKVTLRYRARTVTVPVIDRGPFSGDREYDLTAATKAKLGFGDVGTVLTTR